MEVEKAFGIVLRKHRNKQGYSQENLALLCGLDRTFIGLLERGQRRPTINTIFSLSKELNITASALIKEVEENLRKTE
ncbi:helix-turn-helix domain-containing protein [Bacillus wiedmannii]|uniref:helix-turn-helix domain-containing protein n=1 Tax=Bacillus wiedmannii TaxID=1890302 RepID=UPI00346520A3